MATTSAGNTFFFSRPYHSWVTLPGGDGREVCNQLKKAEDTAHIPIILFFADNISIRSLKGCKPDAVIEKPFDSAELVSVIQKNLN